MIKKINNILPALLSLLGVTIFFNCRNRNTYPTALTGKSLLWEISGKDLAKPSYFFGTMHLMCAEDAELTRTVKSVIKQVDQIYLEVDMDNASELLTTIFEQKSKNGKTLQNTLSPGEYDKVKRFFERYQPSVPFSVLEGQPPLMISSGIYELLLPCRTTNGVEMKIIDEAYKEQKQTKGLETIAFQSSIIDSIPYEEQANDLVKIIDNLDKNRKAMNKMMQVYKSQDIEQLHTLAVNDDSSMQNHFDILLYKRNQNWVNKFASIAKDSSILFAVGAGHFGGNKGVLQLLRSEGYIIRALRN